MHSDSDLLQAPDAVTSSVVQTLPGTVLVLGAGGFIGGHVCAALQTGGWKVWRGVRAGARTLRGGEVECDFARLLSPADWEPLLAGVDAVVNVAGILRETRMQRFEPIHVQAPLALARACIACGVQRLVQVSALGHPADGEFIASKHRGDAALLQLPLEVTVLRPSVVYSTSGSWGGTSLLRAMAAVPVVVPLPGDGRWQIQPLAAEDLAQLVVRALQAREFGAFEVGGPQPMSLRDYQHAWRRWLGLGTGRVLATPDWLVSIVVKASERLGGGPMAEATWRMLRTGNVTEPNAAARLQQAFGFAPRALQDVLDAHPAQLQDRWHARLALLVQPLRVGVAALFLLSAWAGFVTPAADIESMVQGTVLASLAPVELARAAGGIDLLLAAGLLSGRWPRLTLSAMTLLVLGYTLVFGSAMPAMWLDPLGGLAKNLVVLPALAVLWVLLEPRR
jgi:uncharacterized protein YbjT (DUF2867 family)